LTKETIIFGQGFCADEIKRRLAAFGCPVATAIPRQNAAAGQDGPEQEAQGRFVYDRLLACKGSAGDLTLLANVGGEIVRRKAATVILAGDGDREPDFAAYGLPANDSVVSLARLQSLSGSAGELTARLEGVKRVAFLTGIAREKIPAVCEEVMRLAMRLQSEPGVQTFIYTRNLKVAAWGLEALYRETRTAGVVMMASPIQLVDRIKSRAGFRGKGRTFMGSRQAGFPVLFGQMQWMDPGPGRSRSWSTLPLCGRFSPG